MRHSKKRAAFLFLWLGICLLVCFGTGYLVVRWSEASFYRRAALMAAGAPEKAGDMMRSLKWELPEDADAGEALLRRFGYEEGLFTLADSGGLAGVLLLFFILFAGGGMLWYAMEAGRRKARIQELADYLVKMNKGEYPEKLQRAYAGRRMYYAPGLPKPDLYPYSYRG